MTGVGPLCLSPSFSRSAQVVEASLPDSFLLPLFAPLTPSLPSICHDREPLTPPIDWPRRPVEASQQPTALPSALIRGCHNLPFSRAVDAVPTQKALDSPRHGRAGVHLLQPLFSASTFQMRPRQSRCETMVGRIENARCAEMYAQNKNIHAMHTLLVYAPQPQEANHGVEHARRDSFYSSLSRPLFLPRVLRRRYREARLAICCKGAAAKHRAEGESGEGERVPPVAAAIYLSGHGSLHMIYSSQGVSSQLLADCIRLKTLVGRLPTIFACREEKRKAKVVEKGNKKKKGIWPVSNVFHGAGKGHPTSISE